MEILDRIDNHNKTISVLWINLLDKKNLIFPIIKNNSLNYAQSLNNQTIDDVAKTVFGAIWNIGNEPMKGYSRIATDSFLTLKLQPTDGNPKKV